MKIARALLFCACIASCLSAATPTWDTAGNGLLNGTYNFRQVQYTSDGSGNVTQQIAYFGGITFDGAGNYTLSGSNTLVDSAGTLGIYSTGTYSVAASGYGILSNPLSIGNSVYFLVSNHILIGSSTESGGSNGSFVNDMFIGALATPTFTRSSFSGSYTTAGFEPNFNFSWQWNPDGAGSLGTPTSVGNVVDGGKTTSGTPNVTYSFSGGTGLISFNGVSAFFGTLKVELYPTETLYLSPDGNFIFGGSPSGYDIYVGVRKPSAATSLTSGLYYEVGFDQDGSNYATDQSSNIDSYYGVFNAFSGNVLGHERLLYAGSSAEGVAYTTTYPTGSYTGLADVGQLDPSATVQYTVGAGGIRIGYGVGPWLGIEVALPATAPTPSGAAFIDPTGIVNTASSAPFTAGISPGEFITLYNGVNLSSTTQCWTAGPPFPTNLGNVQVMINGVAAPIYCVGAQITVIVPYEVSSSPVATIQVINGNVSSNTVTAFVYKTTPGVFTIPAGGLGLAAAEHGDYSLVTTTNPALPGETIAVYLSGLGSVFCVTTAPSTTCVPPVDGGPAGPKGDNIVSSLAVDVAGQGSTNIPYAGLTPYTAGLYQINFQVPVSAPAGSDVLAIVSSGAYSAQALLPVGSAAGAKIEVPAAGAKIVGSSEAPAKSRASRQLPRLSGLNGTNRP